MTTPPPRRPLTWPDVAALTIACTTILDTLWLCIGAFR